MIGKYKLIKLQKVDSTNLYAENLLKAGTLEEGTIIWAKEQTAGRGQGTNRWESEPKKNLTFTWVLFPQFLEPGKQFLLNQTISLGVFDFIRNFNLKGVLAIKWPNDIYLEYNKMGGILINNIISGNIFTTSIIGIGLNINQMRFVKEVPNPVSLKQVLGYEVSLQAGLEKLVNNLDKRYNELRSGAYETLETDYRRHLLGYQQWRKFKVGNRMFEGKIEGVDEHGHLVVISRESEVAHFMHGEIEYILK
jgi:BirA family transcriptional regulator, biotin operon repressor / biotin---[acetyl-CoA-carboxylase] ligase